MATFKFHKPGYLDGAELKTISFDTQEELFVNECLLAKQKDPDFGYYAKSDNALMAVSKDGERWHVVGYFSDPGEIDLPEWTAPPEPEKPKHWYL